MSGQNRANVYGTISQLSLDSIHPDRLGQSSDIITRLLVRLPTSTAPSGG